MLQRGREEDFHVSSAAEEDRVPHTRLKTCLLQAYHRGYDPGYMVFLTSERICRVIRSVIQVQ